MGDRQKVNTEGVPSTTHKITILWFDPKREGQMSTNVYFHLLWDLPLDIQTYTSQRLIGIDVDGLRNFRHTSKALFREYCRELSERLKRNEIDLDYICKRWIVQRFAPEGHCTQLGKPVLSPLDAAAQIFAKRYGVKLYA